MSERGSFWSTVPGVVTGAAGVLTALVGLLTVSVQLGWIGGGDSGGGTSSSTTVPGASTGSSIGSGTTVPGSSSGTGTGGGTGQTGPSRAGQFEVQPTSVDFAVVGSRQATIVVRNTGEVPLTIKTPTVSGSGAAHFVAGDVSCTKESLQPGRTCELQVAFAPKSGGAVSAVAVIAAAEAQRQTEVQLKGSTLLG